MAADRTRGVGHGHHGRRPAASALLHAPSPLTEASIKMAEQLAPNRKSFHGVIAQAALRHGTATASSPPLRRQHTRPSDRGAAFVHRATAMGTIIDTGDLGSL